MHPFVHAKIQPEKVALVLVPSGETVTYRQLDERSNQAAHLFRSLGLHRGDVIAVLMENNSSYFELVWGAARSGLYFTCISTKLTVEEAVYIVGDSEARVLFASGQLIDIARDIAALVPALVTFVVDRPAPGMRYYQLERDRMPTTPVPDESQGMAMLYSSGTTGRPKGVKFDLPEDPIDAMDTLTALAIERFRFHENIVYLSPAPLYHAAPLRWCMTVGKLGGTLVVMEKFDAQYSLELIENYRVTHAQWVPTHFVRMMKLPPEVRARYDLSSMAVAVHAAAPCPVEVKRAMLEWWGPIIHEFYAGTEFNGMTAITSEEWLAHPGSVGRSIFGTLHICSEEGGELPAGQVGLVRFEGGNQFIYHNDPGKTAEAYDRHGWSTLGDVGWADEDGYLYLTDRQSFMIISGGVNIYPQEIENVIINHPQVADVAVIGAPDEDMGERLVAVVQPVSWDQAGDALAEELKIYVSARLSRIKTPRQFDFVPELPRHATGKLYKRLLRDQYWQKDKVY